MKPMTVGQMARQAGVGIETVRFYEKSGLLETPTRRASGYREYDEEAVNRLRFIGRAKELGFTLGEIRELLSLRCSEQPCDELKTALRKEQWRETARVDELSVIEFRTMARYRIKHFAQAEQLNKETTDKLMKILEDHLEHFAREAKKEKVTRPEDLVNRGKKSIPDFFGRAKAILSDEQIERFKKSLMTPFRGEDRPEAPPAP
jgi:DNA-binding transcriptional MerR regulator